MCVESYIISFILVDFFITIFQNCLQYVEVDLGFSNLKINSV